MSFLSVESALLFSNLEALLQALDNDVPLANDGCSW